MRGNNATAAVATLSLAALMAVTMFGAGRLGLSQLAPGSSSVANIDSASPYQVVVGGRVPGSGEREVADRDRDREGRGGDADAPGSDDDLLGGPLAPLPAPFGDPTGPSDGRQVAGTPTAPGAGGGSNGNGNAGSGGDPDDDRGPGTDGGRRGDGDGGAGGD
ncbi:MAG: hypothetical protein ACRDU8_05540, partial [Egibacteraceae bacterium]